MWVRGKARTATWESGAYGVLVFQTSMLWVSLPTGDSVSLTLRHGQLYESLAVEPAMPSPPNGLGQVGTFSGLRSLTLGGSEGAIAAGELKVGAGTPLRLDRRDILYILQEDDSARVTLTPNYELGAHARDVRVNGDPLLPVRWREVPTAIIVAIFGTLSAIAGYLMRRLVFNQDGGRRSVV